ncbi:MAG: anaerobic ribonucleoside-triphosphate reductase activating protein [Firmicutes bacterium]|nr:anaerobic ribonucleoside-triphosphate reductase activating protein [Bacillota bacterium]
MLISGWVKSSLVDYPGLISCVLFTPGCNYNCFYCHNRSLIDGSHALLNPHDVYAFLAQRIGLLDGIVITGGEPTLQTDLQAYIAALKPLKFKIKLDTNGSAPNIVRQLLQTGACDYYAVDFKAPPMRYREICGPEANPANVLKTINLLLQYGVDFEVRTTVLPQFSDSDLLCMAQSLPIVPRYVLNRYRKPEKYLPCDQDRINQKPYSQDQLSALVATLQCSQPNVQT